MKEADYNKIAKYYDNVIGKDYETTDYIQKKLIKYKVNIRSVLELGCGTGNNLLTFPQNISLTGIDISRKMLSIAKKKLPRCKFHRLDIRSFNLNKKYDLILCLYDTINHLLLFNDWKRLFKATELHLNPNGLFIFDINTLARLEYISAVSPFEHNFGKDFLIVNIKKIFRNTFNWNLKIFENKKGNEFSLTELNIKESAFEVDRIRTELSKNFNVRKIENEKGRRIKYNDERVFFVCQKV